MIIFYVIGALFIIFLFLLLSNRKKPIVYESPYDKFRIGRDFDGGYVICKMEGTYDALISGGIADDISFESDFLKLFPNAECHAFDGTIDRLPKSEYPIQFHRENLGPNQDLIDYIKRYEDVFLKLDIEGHECSVLPKIIENSDAMRRIKQIVIEFHAPSVFNISDTDDCMFKIIRDLNKTHKLVHFHVNNYNLNFIEDGDRIRWPEVFECTFIRWDGGRLSPNTQKIPSEFDMPNYKYRKDVELNYAPFVH